MKNIKIQLLTFLIIAIFFSGCSNLVQNQKIDKTSNKELISETRFLQTKTFHNTNKEQLFRAMINLAQDQFLTMQIDKKDGIFNTDRFVITITKKALGIFDIRISPTTPSKRFDSKYYQYMFEKLRQSLFLEKEIDNKRKEEEAKIKEQKRLEAKKQEKIIQENKKTEEKTTKTKQDNFKVRLFNDNIIEQKVPQEIDLQKVEVPEKIIEKSKRKMRLKYQELPSN